MTDPDDVEAIQLSRAIEELLRQSQRLSDPEQGLWAWFDLTVAVLLHGQSPGRPLSWIMLLTCRRITSEIVTSL